MRNGGRRWSTPPRSTSMPVDGTASFNSARAMLRAAMCPAGPEQMAADASLAAAEEPPWSSWRATALCLSAEAQLLLGDSDRAAALFLETSAVAATLGNVNAIILSQAELAVSGDGSAGDGRRRPNTCSLRSPPSRIAGCTTTSSACLRLPPRPGSPCTVVTGKRRTVSSPGRCEPGRSARSPSRRSPCACACSWPRCTRPSPTRRPHVTYCGRSTTSCSTGRRSAPSSTRSSAFRGILTSSAQLAAAGGPPLTPAELRLLPYLQTHLTFKQIGERLFVSRNTVSSQVGSIYRKLGVSSRSDAVQQATTVGLLGG